MCVRVCVCVPAAFLVKSDNVADLACIVFFDLCSDGIVDSSVDDIRRGGGCGADAAAGVGGDTEADARRDRGGRAAGEGEYDVGGGEAGGGCGAHRVALLG